MVHLNPKQGTSLDPSSQSIQRQFSDIISTLVLPWNPSVFLENWRLMSDARLLGKLLTLYFLSVTLTGLDSATATSTGQAAAPKSAICSTEARFKEALPRAGKVIWIFERLTEAKSDACRGLAKVFEVWVWSGSFSALSKSLVYPLHITEPKPGTEHSLRIEYRSVRESLSHSRVAEQSTTGWFLAAGETGAGKPQK